MNGRDGVISEIGLGVGWQDPAVISETGLCVWRSGPQPDLELKLDGDFLRGRMALYWTGQPHLTPDLAEKPRDYAAIDRASQLAREAVWHRDLSRLAAAVNQSHAVQLAEGMSPLADTALPQHIRPLAKKYCGGGFGGYVLYLFADQPSRDAACAVPGFRPIEPYLKIG